MPMLECRALKFFSLISRLHKGKTKFGALAFLFPQNRLGTSLGQVLTSNKFNFTKCSVFLLGTIVIEEWILD